MKLVVFAYEPFGGNATNISAEVLKRLKERPGLRKLILRVKFDQPLIIDTIASEKPDVILGLGQYPTGAKLRIETQAVNQRGNAGKLGLIDPNGPKQVRTTLPIKPTDLLEITDNAGTYVCNYSMYVLLTDPATKDLPFGFIHIPKRVKVSLAAQAVEDVTSKILDTLGEN